MILTQTRETPNHYVVATIKPWNVAAFARRSKALDGIWHLIQQPEILNKFNGSARYIFFPHWSWKVPASIHDNYECICFHMTDVPYGRGGSPLQNLILRGHKYTMLSALRMVEELDAGPVYLKLRLPLHGRAIDIYERAAEKVWDMIANIIKHRPKPEPQSGEITVFPRRDNNILPTAGSSEGLYDFIRMLDAPTYPKAGLNWGEFHLEFDNARLESDGVRARVIFRRKQ